MKSVKCNLFLFVSYPNDCDNVIKVSDDFKEACDEMNAAGWRKCGGIYGTMPGWGYFCPEHSKRNQFINDSEINLTSLKQEEEE